MQENNMMRSIKKAAVKVLNIAFDVFLLLALVALFDLAILNWVSGCCEPGGACIPESLYPQCRAIHSEVAE